MGNKGKLISSTSEEEIVYQNRDRRNRKSWKPPTKQKKEQKRVNKLCYRCGDKFVENHQQSCRAIGKTCYNCNRKNHLSSCCRSKQKVTQRANQVELFGESEAETRTIL